MTNLSDPVLIVSPHVFDRVLISEDIKWVNNKPYCDGLKVVRSYHVFDEENCPGVKMLMDFECGVEIQ